MPEGHTIHRAARDHQADLGGQRIRLSSPQGRFDVAPLVDEGGWARLLDVEAHGKHLFYVFERGQLVHVHLGLFGRLHRRKSPAAPPRPTTRLRLEGAAWTIDLVGPTACELLTPDEVAAVRARLGPDPLRDDADPAAFLEALARTRAPIGAVLLDQSVIAGVGNVYRAEVLHLLGLHPLTPAREVARPQARALWKLLAGLLRRGVEERRIVTTRGLTLRRPRERVPREDRVHVYRRRACRSCGEPVSVFTLRARTVYACERCQPRAA
jgi:endonuclease-8